MDIWFRSFVVASIVYMVDVAFNVRDRASKYILLFFAVVAVSYACRCSAEPTMQEYLSELLCTMKHYHMKLDYGQRWEVMEKIEWHEKKGDEAWGKANELYWFMPDTEDRRKADYCFTTMVAGMFGGATPLSKVMAACAAFLSQYGLDCLEEWRKIQMFILEAQHHYELQEFYEEVLVKG